jgi:SAM-dependent methyltransferase
MLKDSFCCPICKGELLERTSNIDCGVCGRKFEIINGIPDFFIAEAEEHAIYDDRNRKWLIPEVVESRDMYYRYCTRKLKGMGFCMEEISKRTFSGCCVLEVGMGTGHFTNWLSEVSQAGTEIYAFDYSWPIIEKAKANTKDISGITLFRANARGSMPFKNETFDIVFLRLAPFGPHGVPAIKAGFDMLKPGGWFFEAGWEQEQFETPPLKWAAQHGYEYAEYHNWLYKRVQTEAEYLASLRESGKTEKEANAMLVDQQLRQSRDRGVTKITEEYLLIAQKPKE